MKIINLIRRPFALSIARQSQTEVDHVEVWPDRELSAFETKKVNQVQAWATRQLKNYYKELNPAVKEAKK